MSWNGSGPTSALWSGNNKIQPPTSNYEYLNVKFLSTTLTTASTINTINLNAINTNSSDVNTNTLSTFQVHLSSNTILTGANASLYINGILVTDASNASNVSAWADFPAIANINANNKNIINLTSLFGSNIYASNIYNQTFWGSNINISTLNVRNQFTGSNITASNITIRNTVSAANGNFTNTSANDANFVNTTSVFTNTTVLASVNGTITTLSNTNFRSRTANISNFYGKLMYGENLFVSSIIALSNIYGATIEGETLDVSRIITDTDIYGSNLFVSSIITEGILAGGIQIGATVLPVDPWNEATLYGINDVVLYNSVYYLATAESRAQPPTSNIADWESGSNYFRGNYGFVVGVGAYRCVQNIFGSTISPNADLDNWVAYSANRTPTMWSVTTPPTINPIGGIVGDEFSFITVGTGNFDTLNAPNIVSSNSIHSNIYSYNIYNSNAIDTSILVTNTINALGNTTTNSLNVTNDSQLNTLTTSGALNANNPLNVNNNMFLNNNAAIRGRTQFITIPIPPFSIPQFFNDLISIRNIEVESINVLGGATGNNFFPPYRNNSIVNIGETELSPGILNIYGLNLEDTYALNVYGSGYVTGFFTVTGDTTINALLTVNGITDLNGDTTILGFLDCLGTLDVAGLTTFTGAVNTLGLVTVEGVMNVTGTFTSQTGMAIVGATSFSGGDFLIGSAVGTGNNFNVYIYYNNTDIQNLTVNGNADFRQNVGILGTLTAPNFITSNINASNLNVRTISIENSNATRHTNFDYLVGEGFETFSINSDENVLLTAQSNLVINSGLNTFVISQQTTSVTSGVEVNISADTRINITTLGEFFGQGASFAFTASSNLIMQGGENLSITGGTQTIIGSTNGNVILGASGSNTTQIVNLDGGPILITSSNTGIVLSNGNISLDAPSDINLNAGNNIEIIGQTQAVIGASNLGLAAINLMDIASSNILTTLTGNYTLFAERTVDIQANSNIDVNAPQGRVTIGAEKEVLIYGQDLVTIQSLSNVVINAPSVNILGSNTAIQSISTLRLSTGTLYADTIQSLQMNISNIVSSNITTPALSTITISTATLYANFITAPVNVNFGKSLIPSGGTIDLGATGFNYRQLFISSIRCVSSIITSTITTDRLFPTFDSGVRTANLYPNSAGAQFGFGNALASGGFYNAGYFRSTITTNLLGASDGATTANNIKVVGHLSTTSLGVSTINFKQYPFISTLNNPVATATVSISGSATSVLIQSNTLSFPFPGHYRVDQKYAIHKGSGGGTHGSLVYSSNGTVANISNAVNWPTQGMASVAFLDTANFSTFTTATTTVVANTGNLTRNLYYYDSGSGTYTANFYISPPTITYIPSPGILPDT